MTHRFRNLLTAILIPCALGASLATAQTVWDGGGDGVTWGDAANWDPDGVPTDQADVVLSGGVTVELDVAATTRDLTLDVANLSGPGDLAVAGTLHWGAGAIAGDGTLTVTGGINWSGGSTKTIGRLVDLFCDASWEPSEIVFDAQNGGRLVQHPGYTLGLVDGGSAREGNNGLEQSMGNVHRVRPLDTDPFIDDEFLYTMTLDNLTAFLDTGDFTFDVSTRLNGTYEQQGGTSRFNGGSLLGAGATYQLGDGANSIYDEGTHRFEGNVLPIDGGFPNGLRFTGDQTDAVLLGDVQVDVDLRGPVTLDDALLGNVHVTASTEFRTLSSATLEGLSIGDGTSVGLVGFRGGIITIDQMDWYSMNVRLFEGIDLEVGNFLYTSTQTGVFLDDDQDDSEIETVRITNQMDVQQTGTVPPRFFVDMDVPPGASLNLGDDTEIELMKSSTFAGTANLGGGVLDYRSGTHQIQATGQFGGSRGIEVGTDATVVLDGGSFVGVPLSLGGDVTIYETAAAISTLFKEGGRITGTGEFRAQVLFDPPSPVNHVTIDGVKLVLEGASLWNNGNIDLVNGGSICIPGGASLTCSHSATNLQITADADPNTAEVVTVDGTVIIDQSANPPSYWNAEIQISETGEWIIEPNASANIRGPLSNAGLFSVRDGATASFRFVDSTIEEGGILEGNGTVSESLGGNLILNGIVRPGWGNSSIGTLSFVGSYDFGSSALYDAGYEDGEMDRLIVSNAFSLGGGLRVNFRTFPGDAESHTLIQAGSVSNDFGTVTETGQTPTFSTYTKLPSEYSVEVANLPDQNTIGGQVVLDIDLDGIEFEDPVIKDAVIGLYEGTVESNEFVANATTDLDGRFYFSGRFAGSYYLRIESAPGNVEPYDPSGGFLEIVVPPGESNNTNDFSMRPNLPTYMVMNSDDGGPGSLRDALDQINQSEEGGYIGLSTLEERIRLHSRYGSLEKPAIFALRDSRRSGGSQSETFMTLDGSECGDCDGLVLLGGGSVVQGLRIEGFSGYGLVLEGNGNFVLGNEIVGNGSGGVLVRSGNDDFIGSGTLGQPNEISANGGSGVTILDGAGHEVRHNRIYDNSALAVDLGGDGPTENDDRDVDGGANGLQNAPVLIEAAEDGTSVTGFLNSRPLNTYVVEVYGSTACPETGGWLETALGLQLVTTDANGDAVFTIPISPYSGSLTAVATGFDGSSSESSDCLENVVTSTPELGTVGSVLHLALPNPTSGPTTLQLSTPASAQVSVRIHDVGGRQVKELHDGALDSGHHELTWDGRNDRGHPVASGVYFYHVQVDGEDHQGRIVRIH
ncbi:MAG: right-handed parallel beta-helix repeat-containing protein [Candidatus Eisenbacteria bacterium]|uniref:Right-handed parallel beta-helix repeat-containing protein n=1 Tax=Eiseniibacteriota bacterium TaxID=2212470 RepID=A0A956NES0_UNCEI|nr:right-handed parallel beta-helix repeat-containing protein [Candidatus Eisenbacteria bacterium]